MSMAAMFASYLGVAELADFNGAPTAELERLQVTVSFTDGTSARIEVKHRNEIQDAIVALCAEQGMGLENVCINHEGTAFYSDGSKLTFAFAADVATWWNVEHYPATAKESITHEKLQVI